MIGNKLCSLHYCILRVLNMVRYQQCIEFKSITSWLHFEHFLGIDDIFHPGTASSFSSAIPIIITSSSQLSSMSIIKNSNECSSCKKPNILFICRIFTKQTLSPPPTMNTMHSSLSLSRKLFNTEIFHSSPEELSWNNEQ